MPERVACVHFTPGRNQPEANRARLVELTREAAAAARIVVLPELATSEFALTSAQATACAEASDGPTVTALSAVARELEAVVVVGLALREGAALFNAQAVIDADGSLAGVYRKHHLFGADFDWAQPGPDPGAVVSTRRGRVGLLICHDIVYPRTLLTVVAQRPRLLAFSTAWLGEGETFPGVWLVAARLLDPAPLVAANRGGQEDELRFEDPSAILAHARGGVVGPRTAEPCILYGDLPDAR